MGTYREASGGQAQVEDPVQDLIVQGAIQAHQIDACSILEGIADYSDEQWCSMQMQYVTTAMSPW